jgi:hypothetical protein
VSIKIDLKEIERRANYAAFQDGLTEIFMGLFLFFYGGTLATKTLPLGVVFIVVTVFFAKPLIERVKKRYIYPRAGYVKLPEDPHTTGKGIAIAAVIMVVVLLGAMGISMATLGQKPGVVFFLTYIVPPASGFMLAIGPYWLGQTYGLSRGYIWAVLFVLGGIAMPVFSIASGYEAVGLLCTIIGLIILVTGTILFVQFIRKNPAEQVEIEEAPNARSCQ